MKPVTACALLVLSAVISGCGKDSTPTAATTTRTSPVTEVLTSNLIVQGAVWRIVTAAQAGALTATLTTTSQPAAPVSVGIGVRNPSTNDCLLNRSVIATAGSAPQLSAQVDAGDYCVKVSDAGPLATPMSFTLTIVYP
jgi:hypothetical protein